MTNDQVVEWLEDQEFVTLERNQEDAVPWSVNVGGDVLGIGMSVNAAVEQAAAMLYRLNATENPDGN